jgi:hypothetical protein
MLLCDHIVFWERHRELPVIHPDTFGEIMFTIAVETSVVQIEMLRALIGDYVKKLAADLAAIHAKDGMGGVRRFLEQIKK